MSVRPYSKHHIQDSKFSPKNTARFLNRILVTYTLKWIFFMFLLAKVWTVPLYPPHTILFFHYLSVTIKKPTDGWTESSLDGKGRPACTNALKLKSNIFQTLLFFSAVFCLAACSLFSHEAHLLLVLKSKRLKGVLQCVRVSLCLLLHVRYDVTFMWLMQLFLWITCPHVRGLSAAEVANKSRVQQHPSLDFTGRLL